MANEKTKQTADADWENLKQEAKKGFDVARESLGEVGADLKKSAEALGDDLKKVADDIAQGPNGKQGSTGKKSAKGGDSEKSILDTFKDNLSSDDSSKKLQAWVILIGLIVIVCGILVAIFS